MFTIWFVCCLDLAFVIKGKALFSSLTFLFKSNSIHFQLGIVMINLLKDELQTILCLVKDSSYKSCSCRLSINSHSPIPGSSDVLTQAIPSLTALFPLLAFHSGYDSLGFTPRWELRMLRAVLHIVSGLTVYLDLQRISEYCRKGGGVENLHSDCPGGQNQNQVPPQIKE